LIATSKGKAAQIKEMEKLASGHRTFV